MDETSFEKDSDCSSISTASSKSSRSSTIYSRSSARFIDHFEIFRNKPEFLKFCFKNEGTNKSTQEFRLDELGLDPYICGYLGRENAGTSKEKRGTARLKFLDELEEKCHAQPSILDHGRIISIQYSGTLLTDTEVETWRSQVIELLKNTKAVQCCKVFFPEKQENIDIVKRKLNHHLKERNVVAFTFHDPEHVTEISFAYERDPNDLLEKPDDEGKRDFLEKLADDINHQKIITKSETFEDQQMEVLKIRHKWWKSVLVDIQIEDKTVQISGLEEDVNEVFFKITKALLPAARAIINLNEEEAKLFQSNTVKKFVKKQIESLSGQQCLDWLIDEKVNRIIGPNEGTVSRWVDCIKECVKSRTFDKVPDKVLSLKPWKLQLDSLHCSFKKKLVIKFHEGIIKVTSTSDIHKNVVIMVNGFLLRYTPYSFTIQSNRHKLDFFVQNHGADMEKNFRDECLKITRQSVLEIQVYGTRQAFEEVRRVIDKIVIELSWVARQTVIEFLQREEGNQLLNKVSKESACFVQRGQQSIHLRLFKGKIEEQKVDVIVNSAAPDLTLDKGEVAKSLSRAAGAALQQDIQRQFPKGLSECKVVKGGPGNLQCKSVYHVILPMHITEKKAVADVVGTLMMECLEMANKDKCKSIAFPVFGTGTLDYPPDVVINTMYDVIINYALKSVMEAITVKEIMIILFLGNEKVMTAYNAIEQERINRMNDCTASHKKLLNEPGCLLEFCIVFISDSKENIKKAVAQLEERLP